MRRILLTSLMISVLALAAADTAAADGAVTETLHFTFPQSFVLPNPCTGDPISFTGELDSVVHVTIDPAGRLDVIDYTHIVDEVGTDLITGDTYRGVGAVGSEQNLKFSGFPAEYTVKGGQNFVGPGPGNNLVQHEIIHVTVDANGQVTAVVENVYIECH